MRKYLLPESGNFYKANLHCHSTISDGKKTPEQLKELYLERGYSIIAYTDHRVLIGHNELSDEKFLALNGWELDVTKDAPMFTEPTCHINFIALEPDNLVQPIWNRTEYLGCGNAHKNAQYVKFDESKPDYVKEYNPENINQMMKMGRDAGFYVIWNHPTSSLENYNDYIQYEGMHAMEMFNGGSLSLGYEEYNPYIYDTMIQNGKKIFCVGADDNHNDYEPTTRLCDSFWAFTMIKAESLAYRDVTDALLKGHFYASEGPEIYDLWYEDGKVYIRCSDADKIYITTKVRKIGRRFSENGVPLTEAEFIIREPTEHFRITVVDERGRHACTNTYFIEDLIAEQ